MNYKKIAAVVIVFGLTGLLTGCATTKPTHTAEYSSTPTTTPQYRDIIDQVIQENNLKTAKDLEVYLLDNFRYKSDWKDSLKSPERFVKDKKGDCEDFALFTALVLRRMGYQAEVLQVFFRNRIDSSTGHSVAVFYDPSDKKWHYLNGYKAGGDNGRISRPFDTPEEMAPIIFKNYKGIGSGPSRNGRGSPEELEGVYKKGGRYLE